MRRLRLAASAARLALAGTLAALPTRGRARARRPRRPPDPGVAVRLGGGRRAGRLVRGLATLWPQPARGRATSASLLRLPAVARRRRGAHRRRAVRRSSSTRASRATQPATANLAPTFIFVLFWVGLPFASVLFGDVFRAVQPLAGDRARRRPCCRRASAARRPDAAAVSALARPLARGARRSSPSPGSSSSASNRDDPRTLALLALAYAARQLVGMALFGDGGVDARRRRLRRLLQPVRAARRRSTARDGGPPAPAAVGAPARPRCRARSRCCAR